MAIVLPWDRRSAAVCLNALTTYAEEASMGDNSPDSYDKIAGGLIAVILVLFLIVVLAS